MIDMALRNIWHRKTRSLLTVLGVGLAVLLYVYLSTIMSFYDRDLERTISSFAGRVVVQADSEEASGYPPVDSLISSSQAEAVLAMPSVDVERSAAVLFESIASNPAPNMPPSVLAVGITSGREVAFTGTLPVEGSGTLSGRSDVVLGASAAGHYEAGPGDTITVKGHELVVVGVLAEDIEVVNNAVIMSLDTAQEIFARSDVVSAVLITAQDVSRIPELARQIETNDPRLSVTTSSEMASTANQLLEPQRAFFASIRGTIIAVGIVVVMVVMIMAVSERRREIGTMKAIGAGRRQILSLILWEAVALSLTGGILATIAAWFLTRNEDMSVDAGLAAQAVVIAVLLGAVATLWPAWSANRVDPIESLHYE